ncbi:hypothetical protein HBH98_100210 [Parastagonospora nodorum]|nr:hypothetical protein HBH53_059860 [Parastagonospora nodorum]KAH3978943.1 hypothetical protein HBH51_063910 [Parastagonospora nodorum]KAH3999350.1 hypothetical protein HBI10_120550 [Parastagonospora nodorum]KAH4025041.1 hypothetical protein HBI13_076640 [Parastagonospora nodorum]KAH4032393.1 hypothetical protein HBI09_118270 [Parastagonospora nodorum]
MYILPSNFPLTICRPCLSPPTSTAIQSRLPTNANTPQQTLPLHTNATLTPTPTPHLPRNPSLIFNTPPCAEQHPITAAPPAPTTDSQQQHRLDPDPQRPRSFRWQLQRVLELRVCFGGWCTSPSLFFPFLPSLLIGVYSAYTNVKTACCPTSATNALLQPISALFWGSVAYVNAGIFFAVFWASTVYMPFHYWLMEGWAGGVVWE